MKALLTGAFGNVGMSTIPELLRQGHDVRCFDVPTRANKGAARKFQGKVEVVWGDLRRPADVARAVTDREVVIHVAFIIPKMSVTGIESEAHPDLAWAVNVGGTRNLLDAMLAQPVSPRLIFTSSLHVYGRTQDQPPPRTVAETPHPVEHYARHKIACEEMIKASGLTWAILRLAATLPLALKLDPGMFDVPLDNRIEYVHTRDVGLALANAVSQPAVWGKTLLIGGGAQCQYVYRGFVQKILGAMGVGTLPESAFSTTPFATDWLDTTESQQLLGYQGRTLDDYVQEMLALLGPRRPLIRLFRDAVGRLLVSRSPYYHGRAPREAGQPLPGRVALVTGASSGIGAATACELARGGFRVALVARREDRLQTIAAQIRDLGGEALVLVADLTDERACARVVEEVRKAWGPVDVLVNNAGFGWYGYGVEMPWRLAQQMMQLNMLALTRLTLHFLHDMKARNSGHIINIGSVVGSLPSQGVALYSATKSFVDTFSSALYRELQGTNVHVSVVRPGVVDTEFYDVAEDEKTGWRIPVERFSVRPEAVAKRVWALVRRPRRVAYVPRVLRFVPWVEPSFGWLIDLLGPALLRRQARVAR